MPSHIVVQDLPNAQAGGIEVEVGRDTALLLGEEAVNLEEKLCRWTGMEGCVIVSCAADGLRLSLLAAGVKPMDKVLCSGFAPELVTRSILEIGAVPMLVDINPNSFNIDPFCLKYVLNKCERTSGLLPKVLIATDMFGLPCNYAALSQICMENGIVLIEDMSQAMGAEVDGQKAGSFGRFAVASFSLDPTDLEQLDGGAVLCRDKEDATLLRKFATQWESDDKPDAADRISQNFVRARYAGEWLREQADQMEKRGKIAERYRQRLSGVCRMQQIESPYISAYTQFVIALPDPRRREEILERLRSQGVLCGVFQSGIGSGTRLEDWDRVMLINAQNAYVKLLSIPINHCLSVHLAQRIGDLVADTITNS